MKYTYKKVAARKTAALASLNLAVFASSEICRAMIGGTELVPLRFVDSEHVYYDQPLTSILRSLGSFLHTCSRVPN